MPTLRHSPPCGCSLFYPIVSVSTLASVRISAALRLSLTVTVLSRVGFRSCRDEALDHVDERACRGLGLLGGLLEPLHVTAQVIAGRRGW